MKKFILFFLLFATGSLTLFDEEIIMEKPIGGKSGLFFRRFDQNNFYISNSETNYLFNIRDGNKTPFGGIIPSSSTIYEPLVLNVNNKPSYIVDAFSKNNFIKVYDIVNNKYKEYTAFKIDETHKRKFIKYEVANDNKFVVGIQDKNDNFHVRLINSNGTEIFQSQMVNIKGSDDFQLITQFSGNYKSIIAIVFYENEFIMHQWFRNGNGEVNYSLQSALANQFIKQNNVQVVKNQFFCSEEFGDINCHKMTFNFNGGFSTKMFNVQMLQDCKSLFKLNPFNNERYIISCLNSRNEYVVQLFNANLVRDFGMNGLTIFKDDEKDNFEYDALQGKDNELVVIRADLAKNKYYLEPFNFIKNSKGLYEQCPDGCQNCYFKTPISIRLPDKTLIQNITLNCTLCKFNRYFADSYADICFLKKERPSGYEFMEDYKKFSSCEYCCKTKEEDYMCNTCFNENYKYYVGETNNGRCVTKCPAGYPFINYDKGTCTSSFNSANCNALNND
jgi:hypothetical protein